MRTVFDQSTREELIVRVRALPAESAALWGKMSLFQMLKHCTTWEELLSPGQKSQQVFLGRLFGKMALKSFLQDDRPIPRNSPTLPVLKIKGDGDVESERAKWIMLLERHANFYNPHYIHPFFGKLTNEQIGYLVYKHTDHHLRQFGG